MFGDGAVNAETKLVINCGKAKNGKAKGVTLYCTQIPTFGAYDVGIYEVRKKNNLWDVFTSCGVFTKLDAVVFHLPDKPVGYYSPASSATAHQIIEEYKLNHWEME